MSALPDSPLGVCVLPEQSRNGARTASYPHYVHEILAHAGVCYASVDAGELADRLEELRVLVTVGEAEFADDVKERLQAWVHEGGMWLGVAGVCGMADLFGVRVEQPSCATWGGGLGTLGEGYLKPRLRANRMLSHLRIPLHYFNGTPVQSAGARVLARVLDAHQRPTRRAALTEAQQGKGKCVLIAPDVTGAVVRIQQGVCVTRDGVSSPDGTAPICDGVLKSGDGGVLDWLFDREPVEGAPGYSAYLQPVADQWRELLLRAIFHLASRSRTPLPVLWLYPRNLPAIAHLSHDTDLGEPDKGWRMLEVVAAAGINSTWCNVLPCYPPDLIQAIRSAGHELAMHYDTFSENTVWGEEEFDRQWKELTEHFGGEAPVTNKNHYLRWEGDTELFEWCARRGIRLDQSKGAGKTGEAGFNFGTCHPHFPVAPDGKLIDVLELPTPTQDLLVFAPRELARPLLAAAYLHYGILHLLFHPAHIEKPGVEDALTESVEMAKQLGMEWWTAKRISDWERARRQVTWQNYRRKPGGAAVSLGVSESLETATLLWLAPGDRRIRVNGQALQTGRITRWGFAFCSSVTDLRSETHYSVEIGG